MLESKFLMKNPSAKDSIFTILENVLEENDSSIRATALKMINLIYHEDETLAEPISDFLIRSYKCNKASMTKLTSETLTSLVTFILEKTNLNTESNAVKNTKEILTRVSDKIPKFFYLNLATFLGLFQSEAYLLRNAISEIICNIIIKHLSRTNDDDDIE